MQRWINRIGVSSALVLSCLMLAPPAQAGIFDFLFGGGRRASGNATGTNRGGAVRAGRIAGGLDPTVPYVISPRNSFQTDDTFWIRWNPVTDARFYTVRLWRLDGTLGQPELLLWQTTTQATAVFYDRPVPLQPARYYSVEVIADTGVSSNQDAGCVVAGFSLLFPENLALLNADLAPLPTPPSDEATALALADVYFRHNLLDDAIATLQAQFEQTPTPDLAAAQAELYSYAGLSSLALSHYQTALDLAADSPNPMKAAITLEGAAEVRVMLRQFDQAQLDLSQAQRLYRVADAPTEADRLAAKQAAIRRYQQAGASDRIETAGCPSR